MDPSMDRVMPGEAFGAPVPGRWGRAQPEQPWPPTRRKLRRPYHLGFLDWWNRIWFVGVVALGLMVLAVLGWQFAPGSPTPDERTGAGLASSTWISLGVLTVIAVIAVAVVWFGWRLVRTGIVVDEQGVVVRRVLRRTVELDWPDVAGIEVVPLARSLTDPLGKVASRFPLVGRVRCVQVVSVSGRPVIASGLDSLSQLGGPSPDEIAHQVAAARPPSVATAAPHPG